MIGVTRDGNVMTLEMQRAERRNALNSELVDGLREAIEKAAADDVRAIVLTGAGPRVQLGCRPDRRGQGVAEKLPDKAKALNLAIDAAPIPVIGAINGPAIGAGVILSMICDLRVVAPEAYFQFPVAKYGLALDNWSIRRLTSLVGAGRARGMLMAAERLTADAALQTGDGQPHRHAGRRAGLGRRDRRVRAAGAAARQAGAQRRRRLRGPVARAPGAVRQGVGQPGRHRGAGRAHREAARRTSRAPRCSGGRSGWSAGRRRWSAAAGRCARCRARPRRSARHRSRSTRSPSARRTTTTACSSTSNRPPTPASPASSSSCWSRDVIGGGSDQHPPQPVPLVTPDRGSARRRPRRHLVRPLVGAHRGRRLPRARRPGVERPLLAVARRRPAAPAPGARRRWRRCPPSTR